MLAPATASRGSGQRSRMRTHAHTHGACLHLRPSRRRWRTRLSGSSWRCRRACRSPASMCESAWHRFGTVPQLSPLPPGTDTLGSGLLRAREWLQGAAFMPGQRRYPLTIRSYTRQANCCSRSVPTAYGRRWTDECVEGATNVEYCPLGTPFGNVGWRPAEGWCGKDHRSGDVCTSCTCCCPDAPPDACVQSHPTPGPTPALTPASAPCDDPKGC